MTRKANAKSNFQKRNRKLFTELKLSSCVNEDTDRYERQYAALTYFHSEDCTSPQDSRVSRRTLVKLMS